MIKWHKILHYRPTHGLKWSRFIPSYRNRLKQDNTSISKRVIVIYYSDKEKDKINLKNTFDNELISLKNWTQRRPTYIYKGKKL